MHIRARHHDLAHLHLPQLDGADDEFFFAGRQQAALSRLLNLDLQFLGGMRRAMSVRLCNAERLNDSAGDGVEQVDSPAKRPQEPRKGPCDQ